MKKFILLFIIQFLSLNADLRDMIIILDWREERIIDFDNQTPQTSGFGAQTTFLAMALIAQAAPVIVSSATLENLITRRKITKDFLELNWYNLQLEYLGKYKRFQGNQRHTHLKMFQTILKKVYTTHDQNYIDSLSDTTFKEIKGFLIPYMMPIPFEKWHYYKINDYIFLLIPQNYLYLKQKGFFSKALPQNLQKKYSELSWKFGLKLDKLEKIQSTNITNYSFNTPPIKNDTLFQEIFVNSLPNIFITKKDIVETKQENIKPEDLVTLKQIEEENQLYFLHTWYFFLSGHGTVSYPEELATIAGLKLFYFQEYLRFLNNYIQTDFLYYVSCFPGGKHLKIPYENSLHFQFFKKKGPSLTYFNYIIAAESMNLGLTSIFQISPQYIPFNYSQQKFNYTINFNDYFNEIKNFVLIGKPELIYALSSISDFYERSKILPKTDIPVVRFPNTAWFSLVKMPQTIYKLTKTRALTASIENKDITIDQIKQAIILYADSPFAPYQGKSYKGRLFSTLNILATKSAIPTILTFAPGPTNYYFNNVYAPNLNLTNLIQAFCPNIEEIESRKYYIKNLVCIKGKSIHTFKDVIILFKAKNPFGIKDYFTYNGIIFKDENRSNAALWRTESLQEARQARIDLANNYLPNVRELIDREQQSIKYFNPQFEKEQQKIIEVLIKQSQKIKKEKQQEKFLYELSKSLQHFTKQMHQLALELKKKKK